MVPLDAVGLVLADVEPALRDQLGVGRPIVRTVQTRVPTLHTFEQSAQGGGVTTAALPVNHSPCSTIPSLPDPELVGLFFRKCHISSSSITKARPSGSGFWAYALANCSIQVITLGRAVQFCDLGRP